MAVPPFPSQDLAKLVLGYLAEEQLMTAYDEFLLASPYLDVLRNEYDRIFMTSLKSILAEYRAVKIYVETCKPFMLRKKLFQCSNLLEVVKYLISYIDINKLNAQETSQDKASANKQAFYTRGPCAVCCLASCTCNDKSPTSVTQPTSHIEAAAENSVETTSLSDLPGNSVTRNKTSKDLSEASQRSPDVQIIETSIKSQSIQSSIGTDPPLAKQDATYSELLLPQNDNTLVNTQDFTSKSDESKQKIEEFNNIYNLVCSNNSTLLPKNNLSNIHDPTNATICNAGTFQEFASGVGGSSDKDKTIVPDSSTSENIVPQIIEPKDKKTLRINEIRNIKGQSTPQFLLKVGIKSNQPSTSKSSQQKRTQKNELQKLRPKPIKPDDQKIKIISDVKVDNFKSNNLKIPLKPKTSTPLLQMQTILINGTPAYNNKPQTGTNFTYTKDEIMAMPTIIIVPATSSKNQTGTTTQVSTAQCTNSVTNTTTTTLCTKSTSSTARVLGPLIIDVTSNNKALALNPETNPEPILKEVTKVEAEKNIIQTVDLTHNSVPKDANFTTSNKASTPQVLPPVRKSSSTPRRTSHVRVLDFTTPRRILHETINELEPNKVSGDEITGENNDYLAQSSQSSDKVTSKKTDSITTVIKPSTKENSIKVKKKNWDAELRALAVVNDDYNDGQLTPKPNIVQKKPITIKKKISKKNENDCKNVKSDNTEAVSETKSKSTPKVKKKKKGKKTVDEDAVTEVHTPVAKEYSQKPTINLITDTDWSSSCKENLDKFGETKIDDSDERIDTPETERLSLQNVIGAKLNISDLLETPYKQVLYDIQMETPKFLGPDLPDEPISDIKIMNIPTPRFLNTTKPLQATPSSYSSRPTDYSSGGSYYKPDDQDYIPPSDVLDCAITVVESPTKPVEKPLVAKSEAKEKSPKSVRPQRKCTRNVSYRSTHLGINEDSVDKISISSGTSDTGSREKKTNKSIDNKNRAKSKKDDKQKNETKKKVISITPIKKSTPKKYIRIKPFKKTPIKNSPMRKKTSDVLHTPSLKTLSRKRTSSKEKNTAIVPVVSAAPTKSRRKSSTPRKLNCTKSFESENVAQNSPGLSKKVENLTRNTTCAQDSDSEQQPLRWSDEGSQDDKIEETSASAEIDDIDKIKEFIETTVPSKDRIDENIEGSLHIDLVKRGFDVETAKIIERDLLDSTPVHETFEQSTDDIKIMNTTEVQNVSDKIDSDGSMSNNLQIVQNDEEFEEEEIELSTCDCNEETKNYITCEFDETKFVAKVIPKVKEKFSMEVCIEDGLSVRLRAMPFENIFEISDEEFRQYNPQETEAAVKSITNIDKLSTPMKDPRAQCYELFDSTLTSIDTPLKSEAYETTITEIVLEVENIEKMEYKKRKRVQSGNSDDNSYKKPKSDTQYLLNTANIQNIDIESVLSKLHGP